MFARVHSPTAFTLVVLCFFLPLATVSLTTGCEGGNELIAQTSFTGMQLATHSVPRATVAQSDVRAPKLSSEVEKVASFPAEIALGAAIVGLVLGLLGFVGGGWCALVGLGALLQVAISLSGFESNSDLSFDVGFGLACLVFCWAGVLHFVRFRRRRPVGIRTGTGPRGAAAAIGICVLGGAVVAFCLWLHVLWLAPLLWAGGLYAYRAVKASAAARDARPG